MIINSTQLNFGTTKKQFKRMFKTCSYSGENFRTGDTATVEHIIPQNRLPEGSPLLKSRANMIIVKRSWNSWRSDRPLGEVIKEKPEIAENLRRTLKELEGKVVDGMDWVKEVKKTFLKEIGHDIFK